MDAGGGEVVAHQVVLQGISSTLGLHKHQRQALQVMIVVVSKRLLRKNQGLQQTLAPAGDTTLHQHALALL